MKEPLPPGELTPRERWIVGMTGGIMTLLPMMLAVVVVYLLFAIDSPVEQLQAYYRHIVETWDRGDTRRAIVRVALPIAVVALIAWLGASTLRAVFGRRNALSIAILAANATIGIVELACYVLSAIAIVTGVVLAFVGLPFIAIPLLFGGLVCIIVAKTIVPRFTNK